MATINPPNQPALNKKRLTTAQWLTVLFLLVFTLIYMIPFLGAILTAFRTMDDISLNGFWSIPGELTLRNFPEAVQRAGVSRFLLNSFIITIPALAGTIFLSSLSAYALARYKFAGNKFLYFMYVAGTMLPFQILLLPVFLLSNNICVQQAYELGNFVLNVPFVDAKVCLYNSYLGVIMIHIAFQMGFCTFVLRNFMRSIPGEIMDAARIDGSSEWGIYWRIVMPLTLPGIAAVSTLEFTWIFNDYIWALILLADGSKFPVTQGLSGLQGQFTTDWPLITAGALVATLPTLIVFFALQRYFIGGLTLGSVK
ncbi:MAG: carbohydrate ABC transporter permease [Chloroflexota bacterium]